ncbi:hypothetical protein Dimus_009190 [Dionaea muscipula]
MEDKKQVGSASSSSPSSSFPSELFGTKEPSETDVFSSIFAPRKAAGSSLKPHKQDNTDKNCYGAYRRTIYKDKLVNSSIQEEKVQPCYLSSSLYYGGQEMYPQSSTTQISGSYARFKKDAADDDDPSGNNSYGVPRGNWWEGSLYY